MSSSDSPNVVYILTDDQRAGLLGRDGHPVTETPHIDTLAVEGVQFEQTFCTSPLCTPSRTSHYLGQWERKHGVNFNSGSAVAPTTWNQSFPAQLRHAGYFTGWIGKNHVPVGEGGYASGRIEDTFDYWYGNHNHSHFYPKEQARGDTGIYQNAAADTQPEVFEEGILNFLDPDGDGAAGFRNSCPSDLPERPEDRPFCLCVTFNLPHNAGTRSMQLRPSDPERYITRYRDQFEDLPLPASYIEYWDDTEPKLPREIYRGEWIPSYDYVRDPSALREEMIRQCQTVSAIDRVIGRIRETLASVGEAENTIIVFSTDHGVLLGEHGLGGKGFLYDPVINIPLVIYDPRLPSASRGQVRTELAVVPDLAPTVLDLAGVEIPAQMQGRSLRPLLYDRVTRDWRDAVFLEQLFDNQHYPMSEGIRTETWKYVRYFDRTPDPEDGPPWGTLDDYEDRLATTFTAEEPVYEELYYLPEDPHEETNLASDAAHAETVAELRERTNRLAKERYDRAPPTVPFDREY